jgi:hypothetical protein
MDEESYAELYGDVRGGRWDWIVQSSAAKSYVIAHQYDKLLAFCLLSVLPLFLPLAYGNYSDTQ